MEIQELISFTTIVQQGSFSKASKKLDYCQGSITIHIKNLERELGVQLFDRLGKKVTLTNHGKTFYQHCLKIIDDISCAKEAINPSLELNGHLTIGTIDSLCSSIVPQLICKYHQYHPHVSVSITTDTIEGLLKMLKNNDIDFAYLVDKQLLDTDLLLELLKLDQYISFLPKYILEDALKNKTITQIDLPDYQIDVYRQLLCHKDKWLSHEMKAFFQLIKEKY